MIYEVVKKGGRLFITVENDKVVSVESPTHGCFEADFIGDWWPQVRKELAVEGFTIIQGH